MGTHPPRATFKSNGTLAPRFTDILGAPPMGRASLSPVGVGH